MPRITHLLYFFYRWIQFANVLRILTFILKRTLELQFSILAISLSGFCIRLMPATQNELKSVLLFYGRICVELISFPIKCLVKFTNETVWVRTLFFQKIVNCSFSIVKKQSISFIILLTSIESVQMTLLFLILVICIIWFFLLLFLFLYLFDQPVQKFTNFINLF